MIFWVKMVRCPVLCCALRGIMIFWCCFGILKHRKGAAVKGLRYTAIRTLRQSMGAAVRVPRPRSRAVTSMLKKGNGTGARGFKGDGWRHFLRVRRQRSRAVTSMLKKGNGAGALDFRGDGWRYFPSSSDLTTLDVFDHGLKCTVA